MSPDANEHPDGEVLIVEDEPATRMNAAELLESEGYSVIEAADAETALRLLKERPEIRVLFSDIHLAGNMTGLDLAESVTARWPDVMLLITTGDATLNPDQAPPGAAWIDKPYEEQQLLERVRSLFRLAVATVRPTL